MTYKNAFTKGFGLDFINIQAIKWEKIERGRSFLRKSRASFTYVFSKEKETTVFDQVPRNMSVCAFLVLDVLVYANLLFTHSFTHPGTWLLRAT